MYGLVWPSRSRSSQGQDYFEVKVIPESNCMCLHFYPEAGGWLPADCSLVCHRFVSRRGNGTELSCRRIKRCLLKSLNKVNTIPICLRAGATYRIYAISAFAKYIPPVNSTSASDQQQIILPVLQVWS